MSRSAEPPTPEHLPRLHELIRTRIAAAGGWLPFSTFMELALYSPGLGYYSAGQVKLGAAGDFVTAPELSDLFSHCIARQCAEVLEITGGSLLELGAGTGRMAGVVLRELAARGALPQRYLILEVSADLRERQQQHLAHVLTPDVLARVHWLDRLPDAPLDGIVLANEVLDALPFERFVLRGDRVQALGVEVAADGAFHAAERAPDEPLAAEADALLASLPHRLSEGYVSELSLHVRPWIAALRACLGRGVLLALDYGLPRAQLYHPERTRGTLRCHFRHQAHEDPFVHVGLQDITAWVDFTRVAAAGLEAGAELIGFTTQAAFLLATGITLDVGVSDDQVTRARRAGEMRRLLLPGEMGEAVKVMALGVGYDRALSGFGLKDLRDSL